MDFIAIYFAIRRFFVHCVRIISEQWLLEPPTPVVWLSLQSMYQKESVPTLWHTSPFLSASATQSQILFYLLPVDSIGLAITKNEELIIAYYFRRFK